MNNTDPGFKNRLCQTAQKVEMVLPPIGQIDFRRLDAVLESSFLITFPGAGAVTSTTLLMRWKPVVDFCSRMSALVAALLQAVNIPVFEKTYILDVETTEDQKNLKVSLLTPFIENAPQQILHSAHNYALNFLFNQLGPVHARIETARILDYLHDSFVVPHKAVIGGGSSTIATLSAAYRQGIPFIHLGSCIYQLGWGSAATIFDRSAIASDSAIGSRIAGNKYLTSRLLKSAAMPVPASTLVPNMQAVQKAIDEIGFPVVVKPTDCERGEGVSIGIRSAKQAADAYEKARELSENILVEKEVPGWCHRILVFKQQVLYVVKRLPKCVEGDGRHSVQQLIRAANAGESSKAVHLRSTIYPEDELAVQCMRRAGFELSSIPAEGVTVPLRPIQSTEWGGTPQVITEDIHPENARLAIEAARLLRLESAGIDLITPDIRCPWFENGAAINEINYAPRLGMDRAHQRSAVGRILEALFPAKGRIPVEVFVGDAEALSQAQNRSKELLLTGQRGVLLTADETWLGGCPTKLAIEHAGIFQRCRSILVNRSVDAVLLVIQNDELLSTGLPVDSIDSLAIVNTRLCRTGEPCSTLDENAQAGLIEMLEQYSRSK